MAADRVGPVSGVAAVALILGSFAAAGTPPASDAPLAEVATFYSEHDTGQVVAASLLSLGALCLLVFAATICEALRRVGDGDRRGLWLLSLGGAIVLVVGLALFAGLSIALGRVAEELHPAALQSLHVLNQELFFPVTIGTAAFMLGAGFAVLRTGWLPRWLGWVAIVAGVVAAIPSHVIGGPLDHIGFFAFGGLGLWTLVVSVLLFRADD